MKRRRYSPIWFRFRRVAPLGPVALLVLVAALAATALGQPLPAASGTAALAHVAALSQQIGSRPAASPADARAADYIVGHLQALGYRVERQSFPFRSFEEVRAPELVVLTPAQAVLRPVTLAYSTSTPRDGVEAEVTAAGLGREEDMRGLRLDGKVALIERGQIFFQQKVVNAATAGAAAAVIYNNQPGPAQTGTLLEPSRIAAVMISQDEGQRLLQWLRAGPVRVRLVVGTAIGERTSQNIIGIKAGARLPGEVVVVGGHADSVPNGPGANDNASGVAAMLEAARVLAAVPTARTVHFVAFGAEEVGLIGSRFYVDHRNGTIVGMVNMDMVGHGPGLLLINSGNDNALVDVAERVARRLGISVTRVRLREGGSDHLSFERAGIPVVFIHTGDDSAMHTPDDVLERVDPHLLEQAAGLAAGVVLELANPPR